MAAASYIVRDGADAMAVSLACLADTPAGAMRNRSTRNRTTIAKIFTPMAFTVAVKPGRLGAGNARKVRGQVGDGTCTTPVRRLSPSRH
jgi:hypothetical protein